jgi:hypothetical protein
MPSRYGSQVGLGPSHSGLQFSGDSLLPHSSLAGEQATLVSRDRHLELDAQPVSCVS